MAYVLFFNLLESVRTYLRVLELGSVYASETLDLFIAG